MKNTFKGFLLAIAMILCLANVSNAQNNNGGANGNGGNERLGIVISMDHNTGCGHIQDQQTGEVFEFKKEQQGAIIAVIIGNSFTFRLITLPNGKPPIVVDVRPIK